MILRTSYSVQTLGKVSSNVECELCMAHSWLFQISQKPPRDIQVGEDMVSPSYSNKRELPVMLVLYTGIITATYFQSLSHTMFMGTGNLVFHPKGWLSSTTNEDKITWSTKKPWLLQGNAENSPKVNHG